MRETWLIYATHRVSSSCTSETSKCDMTYSKYVWHNSFETRVIWRIQHICDMTHWWQAWHDSYTQDFVLCLMHAGSQQVWHDSFEIRVTWRIENICAMTHLWHATWLIYARHRASSTSCTPEASKCDMTHSKYVLHDALKRSVTWLIYDKCDMTHTRKMSCVVRWHVGSQQVWHDSFEIRMTWLIEIICDIFHTCKISCVMCRHVGSQRVWHDWFGIRVTWHIRNMRYVIRSKFVTCLLYGQWEMTHIRKKSCLGSMHLGSEQVWHDSFIMCVAWLIYSTWGMTHS